MDRYSACKAILDSNLELEDIEDNNFLQSILIKDHGKRPKIKTLMKTNSYLSDIDWHKVYNKKITPPSIPDKINVHKFGQM